MKTRGTGRKKRREGLGNRLAIIGITIVVLSLAVVVNVKNTSMEKKLMEYQAKEESLIRQVENEQKRVHRGSGQAEAGTGQTRRDFAETKTKRQLEQTRLKITDIGSFPAAYIVVQEGIFCVEAKTAPGYG